MASTIPAEGTTLSFSTDGETFTSIGEVVSCGLPGGSVPVVDKTRLLSSAKEKRPGLIPDMGQISFRLQFDPNDTQHQALRNLVVSPEIVGWRVVYNDGLSSSASDEFEGFISEWAFADAEDETNVEADITVEITGTVVMEGGQT